uniref:Epstein-Barr virus induced 3 n=2 Tax=Myripristis murdjan TaxID=586833 RepID=A0A668ABX7_9TELE
MAWSSLFVTLTLLSCIPGHNALDLLKAATASNNLPAIPAVQCWCAGYPNQTLCSWPETSQSPPTQYIATYSERHTQSATKQCHLIPPGSSSSALSSGSSNSSGQLWHCHLGDLKLLTDYIINITAVNPVGSSSHLTSFMLEDIVKPDPPIDVRVSPRSSRKLMVVWSPPPTWSNLDIFPLKYQIQYQWENRGTPQSMHLGPFERTRIELGLTPGRTYLVQVCALELLGLGECSNWSSPVKITMPKS